MANILKVWDEESEQYIGIPAIQGRPGGCLVPLWTNSNPATAFAAQKITLPANTCDLFRILFEVSSGDAVKHNMPSLELRPGDAGWLQLTAGAQGMQSGNLVSWAREVSASTQTSITFGEAKSIGAMTNTNNAICVPVAVYGLYTTTIDAIEDIYSTTEVKTKKQWIDGKPIYRKVVDCGALTASTWKVVSAGISASYIVSISGMAQDGNHPFPIPFALGSTELATLYYRLEDQSVAVRSPYASAYCYVIIEYTK